jgi:hypothetical protein
MAIAYKWTCSACGASNAAGTDKCARCGINAITSTAEIERQRQGKPELPKAPPLPQPKRFVAGLAGVATLAGVAMERFTAPPMLYWYIGMGLAVGGGLTVFAMLRGRNAKQHDT